MADLPFIKYTYQQIYVDADSQLGKDGPQVSYTFLGDHWAYDYSGWSGLIDLLNDLGMYGWELAGVFPNNGDKGIRGYTMVLKKRVISLQTREPYIPNPAMGQEEQLARRRHIRAEKRRWGRR